MKKCWSNKKFLSLWIPILSVLLVLIVVLTVVANMFAPVLDVYAPGGRGQGHIVTPTDENGDPLEMDANYYEQKFGSDEVLKAREAAEAVAEKIADEGIVLLKNKDHALPLQKGSAITGLGRGYVDPIYGGAGSGRMPEDGNVSPHEALKSKFEVNESAYNTLLDAKDDVARGETNDTAVENQNTYWIGEMSRSVYEGISYDGYKDAAVIFISRRGSEGGDLSMDLKGDIAWHESFNGPFAKSHPETANYADGQHQLELSREEEDMIDVAKTSGFEKIFVVICSSNIIEAGALQMDDEIDGIIWMGGPGNRGCVSLAKIICGEVNPSGRTVDTWSADFTLDASFENFSRHGKRDYTNIDPDAVGGSRISTTEYEEGIYVGYRYFETMYTMQGENAESWWNAWQSSPDKQTGTGVVYPFGYGLSYTTFEQKVTDFDDSGDEVSVTVEVANTGTIAGKDTVQLYYDPPYGDFDKQYSIEKAAKNLIAFAKTDTIEPGKSESVTLTFNKEDMASYCYTVENADGTKGGYVLEEGEYTVCLGKNAHESYETRTIEIPETIWYTGDDPRLSERHAQEALNDDGSYAGFPKAAEFGDSEATFRAASNLYDDITEYMHSGNRNPLTRAEGFTEWKPTAPEGEGLVAPDWVVEEYAFKDYSDGKLADPSVTEAPVMGKQNGLSLSSLRGQSYYSPMWDDLLDQLTMADYENAAQLSGSYSFAKIDSISKPANDDADGPQGVKGPFSALGGSAAPDAHGTAFPSNPIVAATFNTELTVEYGEAVGQELLALGYTGWYASGQNIHRSPFSGRNYEYYSEDPLLCGKMGAGIVQGAASQGAVCYMKHFMLNDQESDRNGGSSWCDEQAMREIYLRAFEIAIKEPLITLKYTNAQTGELEEKVVRGAMGLMSSYNRVGAEWVGGSKRSLTDLVRGEWGFEGSIITDYATGVYMNADQTHYAGGDQFLSIFMGGQFINCTGQQDTSSPSALWSLRNSYKNMLYAMANSSLMNGMAPGSYMEYDMSPWAIALLIVNIVVYAFIAAMVVYIVLRVRKSKKHPELYDTREEEKARKSKE